MPFIARFDLYDLEVERIVPPDIFDNIECDVAEMAVILRDEDYLDGREVLSSIE